MKDIINSLIEQAKKMTNSLEKTSTTEEYFNKIKIIREIGVAISQYERNIQ